MIKYKVKIPVIHFRAKPKPYFAIQVKKKKQKHNLILAVLFITKDQGINMNGKKKDRYHGQTEANAVQRLLDI